MHGKYSVSVITFNVSNLTLFDICDDLGSNSFQERGDDDDQPNTNLNHDRDQLKVPSGPITWARIKKLKETLKGLFKRYGLRWT